MVNKCTVPSYKTTTATATRLPTCTLRRRATSTGRLGPISSRKCTPCLQVLMEIFSSNIVHHSFCASFHVQHCLLHVPGSKYVVFLPDPRCGFCDPDLHVLLRGREAATQQLHMSGSFHLLLSLSRQFHQLDNRKAIRKFSGNVGRSIHIG